MICGIRGIREIRIRTNNASPERRSIEAHPIRRIEQIDWVNRACRDARLMQTSTNLH